MNLQIRSLQRHYPLIYFACHVDHVRKRSTPYQLSTADSILLSHLNEQEPVCAGELARHCGVEAMAAASILDQKHVRGVLARLTPAQRKQALAGLALLAEASRQYSLKKHSHQLGREENAALRP